MDKKWIAINLILLVSAGLLAWQLVLGTYRFNREFDTKSIQTVAGVKIPEVEVPPRYFPKAHDKAEFQVIADQNLFAESRSQQKEEAPPVQEVVPELKSKPILVGVIVSGKQRLATIIEPSLPNATQVSRRGQTMRLGDAYHGYIVVDITEEEMVLEYGSRREVIPLTNSSRRTQSGKTPVVATRVVEFGGKAPTENRPTVLTASAAPGPVIPSAEPAAAVVANTPQSSGRQGSTTASARSLPGAAAPRQPVVNRVDDQTNRRVLRTPFGDIVTFPP